MISKTEQWKLSGDCSKCRRKSYCNKRCTAHIRYEKSILRNAVSNYVDTHYSETLANNFKKYL